MADPRDARGGPFLHGGEIGGDPRSGRSGRRDAAPTGQTVEDRPTEHGARTVRRVRGV